MSNDVKHAITPHESIRSLEIYWVSLHRKNRKTIFFGVYYGKQESRTTKEQITLEMDNLSEEILEKQKQGDVIIFMDANAKLGMLDEEVSRNGKFLLKVIDECELSVLNSSDLCRGKVTRVNRKRTEEKSAIDFVLASDGILSLLEDMLIDENEDYVMTGINPSDHNSIIVRLQMGNVAKQISATEKKWNLNAPEEQWARFQSDLESRRGHAMTVMQGSDFQKNYNAWSKMVDKVARDSIGKITIKPQKGLAISREIKSLQKEKKEAKKSFEKEYDFDAKKVKMDFYIAKQIEVREMIENERKRKVEYQFEKMINDCNDKGFWNLCKIEKRDHLGGWMALKDNDGNRILNPEDQKEFTAIYFENLYSPDDTLPFHIYHQIVIEKMEIYSTDLSYDDLDYNSVPHFKEVENIIMALKNNKATTEFPNEILKKGGRPMCLWIFQVVKYFWKFEIAPKIWNLGVITLVHKGKGDRENLNSYRGITVSNSISMICEELINARMSRLVEMTQAQGGSKRNSSTRDHLFLLRGAIDHSLRQKTELYVTFYDVAKAYDRADVQDMLVQAWEHGLKGKTWRLMKALNTELTAVIKTRHGLTREIKRTAGGKQGGKNFGFLFAKLMDILSEEAQDDELLGISLGLIKLAFLLWVDDVVSFAEGVLQQNYTLNAVNEFAKKHKLKWGTEKCKVLAIGKNAYKLSKWNLGDSEIESCEEYRYLGDIITRNNSNQRNIEERENRVKMVTRKVISMCSNEILNRIEMWALMKLHETTTVSSFLTNSESWVLSSTQRNKIDRIELWALKKILNVPVTTPTVAVMMVSGTLFATERIDQRQLIYLKSLLSRPEGNWMKMELQNQREQNCYWAKQVNGLLSEYGIEKTWEEIRRMPFATWKREVKQAIDRKHIEKLKDLANGAKKAAFAKTMLEDETFKRGSMTNILNRSKLGVRALIMGLAGMLDCAKNFHHKYRTIECKDCMKIDDESHRINDCIKYKHVNLYYSRLKFDFKSICSANKTTLDRAETVIRAIWALDNGKNCVRTCTE